MGTGNHVNYSSYHKRTLKGNYGLKLFRWFVIFACYQTTVFNTQKWHLCSVRHTFFPPAVHQITYFIQSSLLEMQNFAFSKI